MSSSPFQHSHRAQSAGRYRPESDTFGTHPYFGDAGSFGGYAPPQPDPADAWRQSDARDWNDVDTGQWDPVENSWDAGETDDQWDAWDSHDADDDHDDHPDEGRPFTLARLKDAWPQRDSRPERSTPRRSGAHRMPAPPAALKGRAAVVAVAAGAVVAAGQAGMASGEKQHTATADYEAAGQVHEIAAQAVSTDAPGTSASPQILNAAPVADLSQFQDILAHGQQYAAELAAQEAAKLRPLFSKFANGTFTSGFGSRWGVQHLGVDIAAPIGTPIYAVEDGTVIDAGPASGFGMWVRLRHDDGTITVYGHVDTTTVSVGQRVMAGDQIATVGNRGFSTGPHCHFEVWLNGSDKIDPLPWLASRGISLGPERD
ncbi:M23 family metallopeptidase [Nocardia sp. NPDC004068]|uniref:M23 family metallopeptidase n=1 Tax=Nocardia sp. NPDC004068 TaxID=3364303 RepID=UPI00369FC321